MKVVVCIKETFDTEARIDLTGEGTIEDQNVLKIINPYDEYAAEEGIRLKEKEGGEVTVVSVGGESAKKCLQHCLAMGADHAVLLSDPLLKDADSHTYAVVLGSFLKDMDFDVILCGRESIDEGTSQVPSRLAELLDLPQINVVSTLEISSQGDVVATRDIDGGTETVETALPAVITVQKGINEVRYPSMRLIMRIKKMPIKILSLADLGLDSGQVSPQVCVEDYAFPEDRKGGTLLTGEASEVVTQLLQHLQDKYKIL